MWLMTAEIVFWTALSLVAYTYAGYPLIVALMARLCPRRVRAAAIAPSVTVLITAHNEGARIEGRIENCLALDYPAERLKVLVVDDGSVDGTPAIVMRQADRFPHRVGLVCLRERCGKAQALNVGMARVDTEMVLLADARQRFDRAVARALVRNLADPSVGAVSGELMIQEADEGESRSGVGLYWRYEKAIRRAESAFGSSMGFTGAVAMMRRDLYRPLPANTLLDDLVTPLRLVASGYRVVFEPEACATDQVSPTPGHEFRRKVRTLAGVLQTQLELPRLVGRPIGPMAAWQLVSHKTLRLVVPYALVAVLATSVALPGPWFGAAVAAQVVGYGLGVLGLSRPGLGRARALAAASTFLLLNWAAVVGAWRYLAGSRLDLWQGGGESAGHARSPVAESRLS
jgi:cellulose synthase/poly-beta-1,6-N-acetylglucosamine synthase-like glycosyltransferase